MNNPQGGKGAREGLLPQVEQSLPPDVVGPWKSRRAFLKWAFPCMLVGFGGYIGSAGLHFASYNFVHEMDEWNATNGQFLGANDSALAFDIEARFASNRDPVANLLGPQQQIAMGSLDKIAIVFPALFVVVMLLTRRIELWTKVMVCTALLAATKGIIGAVTTVPDSSGWEVCRDAHLGAEGYAWLREDRTFWQIITVDFWWFPTYGRPLRYCSDMMFSGHTFFVTLYALGLYEAALIWTHSVTPKHFPEATTCHIKQAHNKKCDLQLRDLDPFSRKVAGVISHWSPGAKTFFRAFVLFCVSALAVGQQAFEIYYVLLSRFHYTSDVVVALILTFLFYTNGAISIFAKQWALRDLHFLFAGHLLPKFYFGTEPVKTWDNKKSFPALEVDTTHSRLLCCVFSWAGGIENPPYPKVRECPTCKDKDGKPLISKELSRNCRGCGGNLEESGLKARATEHTWISRGDIFVPFCCFPCCCLAGREHVYSDNGIEGFRMLINSDNNPTDNIADEVDRKMHMHEGISSHDVTEMKEWAFSMDSPDPEKHGSHGATPHQHKISHNFNAWAYHYSHSISANFLLDCVSRPNEEKLPFKETPARQCEQCKELMPCCTKYPLEKDWQKWEYSHCIGCGYPLEKAKKVEWGAVLHLDAHDMA